MFIMIISHSCIILVKKYGHHPGSDAVPACTVSDGIGLCTSGIDAQGNRNCVV